MAAACDHFSGNQAALRPLNALKAVYGIKRFVFMDVACWFYVYPFTLASVGRDVPLIVSFRLVSLTVSFYSLFSFCALTFASSPLLSS